MEVEQAKEAEKWEQEKQDLPSEIVEQFIEETDLQRVRNASSSAG